MGGGGGDLTPIRRRHVRRHQPRAVEEKAAARPAARSARQCMSNARPARHEDVCVSGCVFTGSVMTCTLRRGGREFGAHTTTFDPGRIGVLGSGRWAGEAIMSPCQRGDLQVSHRRHAHRARALPSWLARGASTHSKSCLNEGNEDATSMNKMSSNPRRFSTRIIRLLEHDRVERMRNMFQAARHCAPSAHGWRRRVGALRGHVTRLACSRHGLCR